MSDGDVALERGLHTVVTAPLIWQICVLLMHLFLFDFYCPHFTVSVTFMSVSGGCAVCCRWFKYGD